MDCLIGPIIDKVIDCMCGTAAHHLAKYSKTIAELQEKLGEWGRAIDTLQGRVNREKEDGHVIKEEVQNFLNEAVIISEKVTAFLQVDCQTANVKCFVGPIPNLCSRRRLTKRAKEMIDELSHVVEAVVGERFHTIISRPILQGCIAERDGFEDFGTRELILKEVMVSLCSREVTKVGLYGMGGVGKTMLAQEVARRATNDKLFKEVVFTTISKTQDIKAIQETIAEKIHLDFCGIRSEAERADRLKRRLKEEKKILIILDDLWDSLELGKLGLNFDRDEQGCKILMTSRSRYVTYNSMDCEKNISVESLGSTEARKLFTKIVGNIIFEQPETATTANSVVDECNGLPLAIKTVGNALKGKELPDWEDALLQLRNSAPKNIEGMSTEVFPSIRLSYDYLESEEAKRLLLLCSLFGEDRDIETEELTTLCVGWGLFSDVDSVAYARRRVHSLVGKLKDRCLLLDGCDDENVKLHDVIRDVMIYFASGDKLDMHSFVIDDRLEDCMSRKKSIKDAKAISLHRHLRNCDRLPETSLNCPHLELFLLSSDGPWIQISDFLQECRNLKALSLFKADLVSLPSPTNFLQNLVTLRLQHCKLDDIDFIGDIKSLVVLDLSGSTIQLLPLKIGQLNRLKVLKLEDCERLEVIKENAISRLTELEELYIPDTFGNWGIEEADSEGINANFDELMNLQKLTSLYLSVRDAETLPKEFLFSQKLERYCIEIGSYDYENVTFVWPFRNYSRGLMVKDCKLRVFVILISRCECLVLQGSVSGLNNNVVYDTDGQDFSQLKYLRLIDCDDIKYIVNAVEQTSSVQLEELHLHFLQNLEAICRGGNLTSDSFTQLRDVEVRNCGRLKNLLPLSITKRLHSIQVGDCEDIEEIVSVDDDDESQLPIQFELNWLNLRNLPKLDGLLCCSTLSSAHVLFTERVVLPKLEILTLCKMDVKRLWADDLHPTYHDCIKNLCTLEVHECDNLTYLSTILDEPKSLYLLYVSECRSLEVIFVVNNKQGGDGEGTSTKLSFPELHTLELADLPSLKKFGARISEASMPFDKEEAFFNETAFPALERLNLSGLNNESLFPDFDHKLLPTSSVINMEQLVELKISNCNKLKYMFSFAMAKSLVKLMVLQISECNEMKGIVARKESDGHDWPNMFPKLVELRLHNLPNLVSLCLGSDERVLFGNPANQDIVDCPKLKTSFDKKDERDNN